MVQDNTSPQFPNIVNLLLLHFL